MRMMPRRIRAFYLAMVIAVLTPYPLTASELAHSTSINLPLDAPFIRCHASIKGDTLTVVAYNTNMYQYKFVDNLPVSKLRLTNRVENHWGEFPSIQTSPGINILYDSDDQFRSYQVTDIGFSDTTIANLPDWFPGKYRTLISQKNGTAVIFGRGEKKFTLVIDNYMREYYRYYYSEVVDGQFLDPSPMQPGRIRASGMKVFSADDTLYSAWYQRRDESFLGLITSVHFEFVLSKYDGNSWSDPVIIPVGDHRPSLLAMHKLAGRLSIVWKRYRTFEGILLYYQSTADQINWSEPLLITDCEWVIYDHNVVSFDENGTLHLLLKTKKHPSISHYTFDGDSLRLMSETDINPQGITDLFFSFDGDDVYLFYTKKYRRNNNKTSYAEQQNQRIAQDGLRRELYYIKLTGMNSD